MGSEPDVKDVIPRRDRLSHFFRAQYLPPFSHRDVLQLPVPKHYLDPNLKKCSAFGKCVCAGRIRKARPDDRLQVIDYW